MKHIIQSYKSGEMKLDEVPKPQVGPGMVLVETKASLVSAGTEKMLVDLAKKSLLGKAKARPDLVKKVIATAKKEGLKNTIDKVRSKLDTPIPLGYSCAGVVRAVGTGVDKFQVGDLVACGGQDMPTMRTIMWSLKIFVCTFQNSSRRLLKKRYLSRPPQPRWEPLPCRAFGRRN